MTEQKRAARVVGPDYLLAGRYRLAYKLGGGGMGAVWLAQDTLMGRKVAVKQVTSTAGLSDKAAREIRNRAMREGRIAARLSSSHAIAMHDVAIEDGEPWLVMEYMPSRSLAQALNITDSLPPYEVAQIGAQVADALTEAHDAGIVHRDIKPGNILIADRGRELGIVKISDFGISRAKGDVDESDSSVITGTPAYFAPEVARGQDPTEASDVFSLGATLYTAIEGKPPFDIDQDSIALLHRVAKGQIIPPTRSGTLTDPLLHMLEPDPSRRPTMAQARDEIIVRAISSRGSIAQLRGAPLSSADGGVPAWAHRSTPVSETRRPSREFGNTIAGLPAVRSGGLSDDSPKPYAPPAFDPPRKKNPLELVLDRIDDVVGDKIDVSPAIVLAALVGVVVLLLIVLIAVL
ncbi:serine/threonine-protein kinase [Rhodococcoides yunnanense]|uniref:serine/threonine-protein kinase n=1 Tax=Rhodococcoides yunnanense TaxID=278209 RepID=UPI00157DAD62|nr:serine/threonine-protein kinase [Rhodococcus yunnanensis]